MKAIRVSAIWCPACIIMRPVYNEVLNEMNIENMELDFDIDEEEVIKLNVGSVLPVLIIYNDNKEIKRIIGEKSKQEISNIIKELK